MMESAYDDGYDLGLFRYLKKVENTCKAEVKWKSIVGLGHKTQK